VRPGPEIWVIDSATGAQRLAVRQPAFGTGPELFKAGAAVGGGAVWSTAGPLIRVSPSDGTAETWAGFQHGDFDVIGWDSGGQILVALSNGSLIRMIGPNRSETIQAVGFKPPPWTSPRAVSDQHGTWVTADDASIWLLSAPTSMTQVATVPMARPASPTPLSSGVQDDMGGSRAARLFIAGPCA
jgi:hypothetical protein